MRAPVLLGFVALSSLSLAAPGRAETRVAPPWDGRSTAGDSATVAWQVAQARMAADLTALNEFRPGYPFWRHVFTVPDGSVLYGSARDGRLLARFPTRGDWAERGFWEEASLAAVLDGAALEKTVARRRDQVAELLEPQAGPVVQNASRGGFLLPGQKKYGGFLNEWAAIYERFGVPADLGLAQAAVESGFSGTIRSSANALGLCQFLKKNWERLNRLTPQVIEIQNQTTQAAFCAAYLTVLATKYGSFIPALSEHHAGIANVGKVLYNGTQLGATDVRTRYFVGADFLRDLRAISTRRFRDVVGTYGNQSFLYSEMVFGNTANVADFRAKIPQEEIYAFRVTRNLPLTEITRLTSLSSAEVKRFNPALVRQVPKGANLYLPRPVKGLGTDVSFWHRPASDAFTAVLGDFVALDVPPEAWEDQDFEATLTEFRKRFRDTDTEEGTIMAAVLGYVMQEIPAGRRILTAYRTSDKVKKAFDEGIQQREAERAERER